MTDLKKLKNQRSGLKSWITRDIDTLETLRNEVPIPRVQIAKHLEQLRHRILKLEEIQLEIFGQITDDKERDSEVAEVGDFEQSCSAAVVKYEAYVEVKQQSAAATRVVTASTPGQTLAHKLPKIELPTFNGELVEWLPFYQSFTNSVDQLSIAKHLKLQLLRSHLKDEPRRLIEWYPLTDESYEPALKAVAERYGNKERLIDAYVEELISLKLTSSTMTLRRIYDKLYSIVNILESLDIKRENFSVILIPMIKTIFSKDIKIEWAKYERQHKHQNPLITGTNRLTLFLEFLLYEVEIREAASSMDKISKSGDTKEKESTDKKEKEKGSGHEPGLTPTAAFLADGTPFKGQNYNPGQQNPGSGRKYQGGPRNLPPCPFCQGLNHHPERCLRAAEFSPQEASGMIRRDQRCIQCLAYHPNQPCRSLRRCMICGQGHHHLLCFKRLSLTDNKKDTQPPDNVRPPQLQQNSSNSPSQQLPDG